MNNLEINFLLDHGYLLYNSFFDAKQIEQSYYLINDILNNLV